MKCANVIIICAFVFVLFLNFSLNIRGVRLHIDSIHALYLSLEYKKPLTALFESSNIHGICLCPTFWQICIYFDTVRTFLCVTRM